MLVVINYFCFSLEKLGRSTANVSTGIKNYKIKWKRYVIRGDGSFKERGVTLRVGMVSLQGTCARTLRSSGE